ncbi:protein of unknown function [Paraburkholderia kururiensis]
MSACALNLQPAAVLEFAVSRDAPHRIPPRMIAADAPLRDGRRARRREIRPLPLPPAL